MRTAYKEMWKSFENTHIKNYENVRNLENNTLFPLSSSNFQPAKRFISPYDSLRKNAKYAESGGNLNL